MGMEIQILKKESKKYRNILLKAGEKALSFMGKKDKDFTVIITGEEEITELNKRFRNCDSPTDVLAFVCGEKHSPYLGDIAISFTQAKKQAKTYKEKLGDELARLVIHGVLHLLGETDYASASKKRMWDKQEKILASLKAGTKAGS
jgi:probable rRNA maturation factor